MYIHWYKFDVRNLEINLIIYRSNSLPSTESISIIYIHYLLRRWTRIFYGTMDEIIGTEDGVPPTATETSITQDRGLFSWIVATFKIKLVHANEVQIKIRECSSRCTNT